MRKDKGSEFIYTVNLDHESASYGVYNFKTFYDRVECLTFVESMAKNNPDMTVNIDVRPRFRRRNVLALG